MSGNPTSPLLGEAGADQSRSERPPSQKSKASTTSRNSKNSNHSKHPEESAPLLSRDEDHRNYGDAPVHDESPSAAASSLRSIQNGGPSKGKSSRRWPTIIALTILGLVVIVILCLGFATPEVAKEYAREAMVFDPTDLSIDSFTSMGVRARIRGDFTLDGSRVQKKPVRDLGRAGTWIARAVESKRSKVKVFLPEYGDLLLGTADVPPLVVDIRDGHTTHLDFLSDLAAGDLDGIRRMANDWLEGRIGDLTVRGVADVPLKSGIFGLGTQSLAETIMFKGNELPSIPKYNITKLNFHEIKLPHGGRGMAADVSLVLSNDYPVKFTVPPLGFDILVQGCSPDQPYLRLADATTEEIQVEPKKDVEVQVGGFLKKLPETLLATCPMTRKSPLDALLGEYIRGDETTVYVRGSESPLGNTPDWVTALIQSVTVPVPFPGKSFDNLIRNFSLADVHFTLPDPFAAPDTPQASPRISATVKALVGLPKEMNFPIDVSRVRADADVFYHEKKFGRLDLNKWQKANTTRIEAHDDVEAGLAVESLVKKAPLKITDDDVFTDVVQDLIFGGKSVVLGVKADVDVETETALGKFVVREIPAEGKVFVKPISGGELKGFSPQVGSLRVMETTMSTLSLEAKINITNPTEYSAIVPYVNIKMLSNGTEIGHATARNIAVVPGPNHNILVEALWDPLTPSGQKGIAQGKELLSQYISGFNTSLTLATHAGTIPHQPNLGKALSSLSIDIPTPKLTPPKNPNRDPDDEDDDDRDPNAPKFIDDATFHLITSTATFTLLSPLPYSTITVTYLNATAYYNRTEAVGAILYDVPFEVPPGASTSPRLPVDWDLGGVGTVTLKGGNYPKHKSLVMPSPFVTGYFTRTPTLDRDILH
ncbi:MAG: hypothetical protein ASARMPRED_007042 [Alectoria sarmentosa]|nr:MAG: hypothetical protein ASARMPRED_007042 [Alectoria sarmentosa]